VVKFTPSIILLHPPFLYPHSWNSFSRSHFSFHTWVHNISAIFHSYTLSSYPPLPWAYFMWNMSSTRTISELNVPDQLWSLCGRTFSSCVSEAMHQCCGPWVKNIKCGCYSLSWNGSQLFCTLWVRQTVINCEEISNLTALPQESRSSVWSDCLIVLQE
jgi:hypothetical protein